MAGTVAIDHITKLTSRSDEPFEARVPGSKSYTNRALLLAAQRPGQTRVTGALHCDDTLYLADCLDSFDGLEVKRTDEGFSARRRDGALGAASSDLFVGAAGTPARFLLSFASSAEGTSIVTGNERLCERPMSHITEALTAAGIRCEHIDKPGCLPVRVHGGQPNSTTWTIDGSVSSQFVSSLLLLAAQQNGGPVEVRVPGHLVSRPYVEMTLRMLNDHGITASEKDTNVFEVQPGIPANDTIPVEVDASGMSYFLVAAAITGTRVRIPGIAANSAQGDVGLAFALERMGCELEFANGGLELKGGPLRGIDIDMESMPDTVLSLAIAAAVASGETRITNIANLRVKECDRIHAAAAELNRLGVPTEEGDDFLVIRPNGPIGQATVSTYDDHRVAMSFGLFRLLGDGVEIEDPACVAKSFPSFWDELARFKEHHERG